jgi:phage protein D
MQATIPLNSTVLMTMRDPYPRALWQVTLEEEDLMTALEPRLIQLTLTDNPGLEADTLDITLSDADGLLDIPLRGVTLTLALGRSDMGLIDKGRYTVDEVEHSGTPDQLTIKARSANLRETLLVKKERSWHGVTVGAIVQKIAAEHGLTPAVSPELASMPVSHMDQQGESDASFLTRLGGIYDAMTAVKNDNLIFFAIGSGTSIGGEPLPVVTITRAAGDRHRFCVADADGAAGVKATYWDKKSGKQGEVLIRESDINKGAPPSDRVASGGGKIQVLRHNYASQAAAKKAATAALKKALRGASTFDLTLALGRPDIIPEVSATVRGWKPAIDGTAWRVVKVTHQLSASGLSTALELELRVTEPGTPNSPDGENDDNDTSDTD